MGWIDANLYYTPNDVRHARHFLWAAQHWGGPRLRIYEAEMALRNKQISQEDSSS